MDTDVPSGEENDSFVGRETVAFEESGELERGDLDKFGSSIQGRFTETVSEGAGMISFFGSVKCRYRQDLPTGNQLAHADASELRCDTAEHGRRISSNAVADGARAGYISPVEIETGETASREANSTVRSVG